MSLITPDSTENTPAASTQSPTALTTFYHLSVMAFFLCFARPLQALTLDVSVQSPQDLKGAVVYLTPSSPDLTANNRVNTKEVIQWERAFMPQITVITKGSTIAFPNKDTVSHHVFSFSKTKRFELPLYKGVSPSITFDTAGDVVIGCNIHDWMIGYIKVLDTPLYQQSDNGQFQFTDLQPGRYQVTLWHPRMNRKEQGTQTLDLQQNQTLSFALEHRLAPAIDQQPDSSSVDEDEYY